jgi:pyruvate,water dikinase
MHEDPAGNSFPVNWPRPADAETSWRVDLMHWPNGVSPLQGSMDLPAFLRGFNQALQDLAMPLKEIRFEVFNGYVYMSQEPWSSDATAMNERMQEMRVRMSRHMPGLLDRWYTEYEPEVRDINNETLNGNYGELGDRDLSALLEMLVAKREREGHLHFLAVLPAMAAVMFFEEVYTNLFGAPKGSEHLQLLQGFPNKSVEAGNAIWRLAQEARKRPGVMRVLREAAPADVHDALPQVESGPALRDLVEEHNRLYGWRANELDMAEETWKENPAPLYALIREYTSREDYDPEEEFRSLVAARRAREAALLGRIAGGPVDLFRQALTLAQQYLPVQEDHNFWIDQQGLCVQRVPALEAGRRLATAGRVAKAEDVFYLQYDELQDALRKGTGDLHDLVARRRAERDHFRNVAPPPELGAAPEDDDESSFSKFFGAPPPPNPDPRVLNGNPASAGVITGVARVITSLDEAGRLKQGEILVCPATMPPWTPLFAIASAVVTDHGGILSHTAIVAREYRIPAVVGTKLATALIRDGQRVTVDGNEGFVRLEL